MIILYETKQYKFHYSSKIRPVTKIPRKLNFFLQILLNVDPHHSTRRRAEVSWEMWQHLQFVRKWFDTS